MQLHLVDNPEEILNTLTVAEISIAIGEMRRAVPTDQQDAEFQRRLRLAREMMRKKYAEENASADMSQPGSSDVSF